MGSILSMFVLLSGSKVIPVSSLEEEVDKDYLETGTNLVSVVSTLFFCVFVFPVTAATLVRSKKWPTGLML